MRLHPTMRVFGVGARVWRSGWYLWSACYPLTQTNVNMSVRRSSEMPLFTSPHFAGHLSYARHMFPATFPPLISPGIKNTDRERSRRQLPDTLTRELVTKTKPLPIWFFEGSHMEPMKFSNSVVPLSAETSNIIPRQTSIPLTYNKESTAESTNRHFRRCFYAKQLKLGFVERRCFEDRNAI